MASPPTRTKRALLAAALLIAALDLAQPLLMPWRPKFVGALAGATLYLACAVGVARGWRPAAWVVALMPVVPLTVLVLAALGWAPVRPDAGMLGVLLVQIAAAVLAVVTLRWRGEQGAIEPPGPT